MREDFSNQEQKDFDLFEQAVRDFFQEQAGKDTRVDIRVVTKNNGVQFHGLTVFFQDEHVTPTIYLEEFYQMYLRGASLDSVLMYMLDVYKDSRHSDGIAIQFFYHYDTVKDTLRIKIINYEKNKELLATVPHIRFLDLAVVCYSYVESLQLQKGSIIITRQHLNLWNVNEERLFIDAVLNSTICLPDSFVGMAELLDELLPEDINLDLHEEARSPSMYVLTNSRKIFGAATIFYPEVLSRCAKTVGGDFYVLPSSVHEVILIPQSGGEEQELIDMVQIVNDEQVAPEEILSYHIYKYSKDEAVLEDVVTGEFVRTGEVSWER